jgi:hypothetical protein
MTAEERVVMITALEEAFLYDAIADFLGTTSMGGAVHIFSNDADAIRAEIPRFREIVLDLIDRKLTEIRETPDLDWDAAAPMTRGEILAALADPYAWIWTAVPAGTR